LGPTPIMEQVQLAGGLETVLKSCTTLDILGDLAIRHVAD